MPSGQKHSVRAKRAEFIPDGDTKYLPGHVTAARYVIQVRRYLRRSGNRPTVRTMRRGVCCGRMQCVCVCGLRRPFTARWGFLITRPRRPYCASESTVHTDTLTEWDSVDISLVISHPRSYFGRSERKLTGLSGWIIPGDWLTGKSKLMNLWQRPRYWNAFYGKKKKD